MLEELVIVFFVLCYINCMEILTTIILCVVLALKRKHEHDFKSVCSNFPVMFSLVYFEFLKRLFLPGDWRGNFGHYQLMLFMKKKLKFSTFSL